MIAAIEVAMTLPGLTVGLAWFLHEREDRVPPARPFGETGRHRRREVRDV